MNPSLALNFTDVVPFEVFPTTFDISHVPVGRETLPLYDVPFFSVLKSSFIVSLANAMQTENTNAMQIISFFILGDSSSLLDLYI